MIDLETTTETDLKDVSIADQPDTRPMNAVKEDATTDREATHREEEEDLTLEVDLEITEEDEEVDLIQEIEEDRDPDPLEREREREAILIIEEIDLLKKIEETPIQDPDPVDQIILDLIDRPTNE